MSGSDVPRTILVTGGDVVPPEARSLIEDRGFAIRTVTDEHLDAGRLHEALDGVSGYLIGGYEEPTAAHFEQAGKLEAVGWVGTDFRGYVPGWPRAFELGIAVVSTPGANAVSVAEFTLMLMLMLARPLPAFPGAVGADPPTVVPGIELHGRTLGIVGAGRIGTRVGRAATLGLGMRVRYAAPRRNEPLEAALGVEHVELSRLLDESDVISLHRPGPGPTEPPLLGRRELERVRPGTLLVNCGHPGLVDPAALKWALEHRAVRAAFDGVGQGEAWDTLAAVGPPRFLSVPQMGFLTREAGLRAGVRAAEAVCDVLSGVDSPLVNNRDYRSRRRSRAVA